MSVLEDLQRAMALQKKAERWERTGRIAALALEDAGELRLAVSGSRHVHGAGEVYAMLRGVYLYPQPHLTACGPLIVEVVQGAGAGVDQQVDAALELWAQEMSRGVGHEVPAMVSRPIPALWSESGRAAGPQRNAKLLDAADLWAGLWDGRTERCGTLDTAQQAAARGWIGWAVARPHGAPGAWLYAVHPRIFEGGER